MLIAVPSKGRAGLTTTNKILPSAIFYVPESELHQYVNIKNKISVPKEVKGITSTRNWILKNTNDKWVVFIDDDVRNCGYTKMHEWRCEKISIKNEEFWINEFVRAFDITEQFGYKIWGLKTESAPRSVYPYYPIRLKRYVTASCMGLINDGEFYFDEEFKVKEDYEICLRHIVKYNGIIGIEYLHWENDHWDKNGGCKDYRTINVEIDAIKKLQRLYPGMVRSAKRTANKFTIQLSL
jgi:glycosyltransferase involved in cell wall biosynthesis